MYETVKKLRSFVSGKLRARFGLPNGDQKMKILFTAPRFHTNQHYPVKALLDAGHEVSFFALTRGGSEEYSALSPLVFGHSRVFSFIARLLRKERSYGFSLRFAFPPLGKFWREVKAFRPSVVIVRGPNSAYGLLSILAAKAVRAKLIFYTQGPQYRKMGPFKRFVRSVFPAVFGAQWITPVLGTPGSGTSTLSRMHYVPFVVASGTPPEKKVWFRDGMVNIMTVGKFQPRKNHVLLLHAIKELSNTFPLKVTIVGECTTSAHRKEFKRVQDCIQELELKELVKIKVDLPFSRVQELYAIHDLFILPSSAERAAVSVLEAMAHGLPVICSDSNGTKCYIDKGQNGYVFRSDDLHDLVANMRLNLEDRASLVEMGRRSYQLVLERHLPESYEQAIMKILVKNAKL